jgi:SAM-dependent methyltransferase
MKPTTRLQLGTSRLERMSPDALSVFLDDSWLHLGEAEPPEATPLKRFQDHVERAGLRSAVLHLPRAAIRRARRPSTAPPTPDVSRANFEPFHFGLDSPLSTSDRSFDFVFAEHFIEHLFLDEALFLFDEVFRLLRPGGVFRVVRPDADLRRNCPPEPVAIRRRRCAGIIPTSTRGAGRSGRCPRSSAERAPTLTP